MICSPTDALNMFFGSDLEYLVMEDVLVRQGWPIEKRRLNPIPASTHRLQALT
jgi:hypothetical protein